AGTVMTARSIGSSTASSDFTVASPWTTVASRLTGMTRPAKPPERRLASTLPPTLEGSRDAPITATLRGANKECSGGRLTRTRMRIRSPRAADREHRTGRRSDDTVRDASEERPVDAATAMRPDHDEVRPLIRRKVHDLLVRRARSQRRPRFEPVDLGL